MLMRILSPLFTAYPQRFWPHDSTRTLPLFSSVAHTPSGVAAGAAATGAGCDGAAEAAAGADTASALTAAIRSVEAAAAEPGAGVLAQRPPVALPEPRGQALPVARRYRRAPAHCRR